mmetsp:Transcript_590/g.781  ORF Transcript_590/g.781 Transcript_590/m.781 type:complete len:357 (-) Transcript_590:374-1444(-)
MGNCFGNDLSPAEKEKLKHETAASKALDKLNAEQHIQQEQINKLLLLGSGESGKSTLFKQMITIYGKGFPKEERMHFTQIIFNNVIQSAMVLAEANTSLSLPCHCPDAKAAIEKLVGNETIIDENLAGHLDKFWKDEGIQSTYAERAKFQLTDSTAYFFEKISEIASAGYIPSEQDVLRSRVRTTGIVENSFEIDGNQFKMFDVGGQRNERKKWIHCFENVTAVLFVTAISEYDQMLFEDESTNRMDESLNLFDEICNSRWFRETAIILFLNKCDLFAEKIKNVSLRCCFPEYDRPDSYDDGIVFLDNEFQSKNRNPDKQIYLHVTCATDTNNIAVVFNAVKDIVIRKCLNEAGLV